jgi:hypothetical protein
MNTGDCVDVPAARKVGVEDSFPLMNGSFGVVTPVFEEQASYFDLRGIDFGDVWFALH